MGKYDTESNTTNSSSDNYESDFIDIDTSDAKDVSDLQARIQAEQAMIQNERVKLAMLKDLQEVQQRKFSEQASLNAVSSLKMNEQDAQVSDFLCARGIQPNPNRNNGQ